MQLVAQENVIFIKQKNECHREKICHREKYESWRKEHTSYRPKKCKSSTKKCNSSGNKCKSLRKKQVMHKVIHQAKKWESSRQTTSRRPEKCKLSRKRNNNHQKAIHRLRYVIHQAKNGCHRSKKWKLSPSTRCENHTYLTPFLLILKCKKLELENSNQHSCP